MATEEPFAEAYLFFLKTDLHAAFTISTEFTRATACLQLELITDSRPLKKSYLIFASTL